VRVLRSEAVDELLQPQATGFDELLEREVSWGLGLQVEPDGSFGMAGIGGFVGYGARRAGLRFGYGYVTRRLGGHDRSEACELAFEEVLRR